MNALFANPAALWAALLIAPLLLLFMLRHRPVRKRVPSIALWQGAAQMQVATSPFQRLRRSLSLLLLLLALCALVLALAGLRIPGARARGTPLILVVDTTASMQAETPGGTRLNSAVRRAAALVDAVGNAPVTVLAWDGALRPASPLETDAARALQALVALRAADYGAGDGALSRALRQLAEQSPNSRIALVADRSPGALPPGALFVPAGDAQPNSGIVAAALTEIAPNQHELFFGLEHFGPEPRRVTLTIEHDDGRLADARDVMLTPGERASVTLPVTRPGLYRATLSPPDALALDDRAWVRLGAPVVQDVALVGEVPDTLRRAITAAAEATGTLRVVEESALAGDVMAVFGATPRPTRLPAVFLLPHGAPEGITPGEATPADESPARQVRHPLWQGAGLPDIRVPVVIPLSTNRPLQPLLEVGPGPALALLPRADLSRLHDLLVCMPLTDEAAGFAARVAFPVFWENWFEHGRRLRDPLPPGALSTAEALEIVALEGRGPFEIQPPAGAALRGAPGEPMRPERAGVYQFSGLAETPVAKLGVSLLDAHESNLVNDSPDWNLESALEALAAADLHGERGDLDLAPLLALLAAALLLFEWFMYRRAFPALDSPRPSTPRRSQQARA